MSLGRFGIALVLGVSFAACLDLSGGQYWPYGVLAWVCAFYAGVVMREAVGR